MTERDESERTGLVCHSKIISHHYPTSSSSLSPLDLPHVPFLARSLIAPSIAQVGNDKTLAAALVWSGAGRSAHAFHTRRKKVPPARRFLDRHVPLHRLVNKNNIAKN